MELTIAIHGEKMVSVITILLDSLKLDNKENKEERNNNKIN